MTQRPYTFFLPLLAIFFWINAVHAQNPERIKTIPLAPDSAYTKVVQLLHESGFYITKLDRPSGFIQTSVYNKNKGLFSNEGDTKIFNFLVSPLSDRTSKIALNIFLIKRYHEGGSTSPLYYDEDKGLVQDNQIYQQVWNKILPLIQ